MATFSAIGGAEPSTLTFKAATVTMLRNSSAMHQELISLADPESSLSIARISSAAPASSDAGIVVRQVGYVAPSTIVSLARTATLVRSSIAQSSTSVTMSAANSSRLMWTCVNNPTLNANLYLKFGATASTADFDVRVPAFAYYEMPTPVYTGQIDGIWDSTGTGFARVTEWQP